ncbi:MAG: hypothetical protein HYX59_14685 [Elusimicrobia bacterium]|nr:hypothetical protein [Elusimicrobiota bacterium]
MRPARLAAALLAAALAPSPSAAQLPVEKTLEASKTLDRETATEVSKSLDAPGVKPADDGSAAALKKLFLVCKKTGDCKPYLLEKKKVKNIKDKEDVLALGAAPPAAPPVPGDPAAALMPAEASAAAPPAGPPPTAERAEVLRRDAGERRERTMRRASGAADTMRRSFLPAEEAPAGSAGPSAPRPAAAPAGGRSVPELALAARAGYAETFRAQGLKVGAGPRGEAAIQRADGTAATEPELDRLRAALSAEPAALVRRPDFFTVLPREKFADLKRDFAARPELRATAFKDIGMTAQARDFQWSVSCTGLSGTCNPHAAQGSYRKGQDVPPEDLDAVWSAAQEEISGEEAEDDGFGEYTEEDRRLAAAEDLAAEKLGPGGRRSPSLASLLARMGELARGAGEASGGPAPAAAGAPVAGGPAAPAEERAAGPSGVPVTDASSSRAPGRLPGPPPPPGGGRTADRRWAYALAAAAAAVLLARGLRRKV